jgi:hypothetical protein
MDLLGLELSYPGFDHNILCEFRHRRLAGGAEAFLLDGVPDTCRTSGLRSSRRC